MQYKQDALLILDLAKKYLKERKLKLAKEEEKERREVEESLATPRGVETNDGYKNVENEVYEEVEAS